MLSQLQKKNLNKLLERYSFEHLRPSPEVYEISHSQHELFFVSGSDRRRRIFFKVQYETEQLEAIESVKQKLMEENINHPFCDQILLKHIYGSKWSVNKTVDRIKQLLEYHNNQAILKLDDQTISKLQKGCFYCYGHDKGMRPNIIMRIDKIDLNQSIEENLNAFYYFMLVVLGFKMVPYHAEKYNLIMDFNDISLTDIPFVYLYESLEKMGIYYSGNTQKTFLFNSKGISNIWRMVSFFLSESQKKRVVFIEKGNQKEILQYIDQYQLQRRYGGKLSNLTTFWPPKNTNESFDVKLNNQKFEQSFYSVQNNQEYFQIETIQSIRCVTPSCECQIY